MFEVEPIVWLQSWASPGLTAAMNGISLTGYTRAYVAIAALLAFALRQRAAVALLLLLAVNGAFTDIAKTLFEAPRPDWDPRVVQALSMGAELSLRELDRTALVERDYGFPSGHVSTTTAFAAGLALLLRWPPRMWGLVGVWIALMALSRMYLGRHFLGDVLGGAALGLFSVVVGFTILKLGWIARELRTQDVWPAWRLVALAGAATAGSLLVGLPDAGDAGRLLGMTAGVLVLVRVDVFALAHTRRRRALLFASAASAFAIVWGAITALLLVTGVPSVSPVRFLAAALPNAALLTAPALLTSAWRGSAEPR